MTVGNWTEAWQNVADGIPGTSTNQIPFNLFDDRCQKVFKVLSQPEPATGLTPKEVIWRKNKMRVYRFSLPAAKVTKQTPVFMLYAMINKPYILDIEPGNSFVEHLLMQGFDVYMLDWGEAGPEDCNNGFAEYIFDYLHKAVERVCLYTGKEQVHMFSYCMGGTMGAMYTTLYPERVKNLVVLAAPIDFRHADLYNTWLDEKYFDVDRLVETYGNIPPEVIDLGNKMLKPMSNFINPWVYLMEKVDNENFVHTWRLLNKWVNDGTAFPGETYRQWIRDFYQQNKLIKGEIVLRDRRVDLANIKCPVLLLTAAQDHIAPCEQTRALFDYISSQDKTEYNYPVGHVSLVFSGMARNKVYPETAAWLAKRD
ncbi:class III poly(R)-hydroxyalkanoic acid synthase subunit PhaC [Effusibacillus lacus]|uniref:Poly(3-hydroxyalkanoate) polymerase subunit PhaC n=1 Tax=Effusibacillus lacus TaxID=1348429 RepID=A0A292YI85_9BACL|nr:class III poly(R)-hydroxyalkanoic acid synthase subunit PhaC [Effusibacillus lacus]TCS71114.1 polyhydroxyalkanoate synthase [Effusibacillus lacus]GAX90757.1 class III poly(R)-hydroxyalkanoic acid synthase subunit PhaC [Effusibacillus lacus]